MALISGSNHDFGLRAAVYTEMLILDQDLYDEIASESERFVEYIETEAIKQEQLVRAAMGNLHRFAKLAKLGTLNDLNKSGPLKKKDQGLAQGMMSDLRNVFVGKPVAATKAQPNKNKARVAIEPMDDDGRDDDGHTINV